MKKACHSRRPGSTIMTSTTSLRRRLSWVGAGVGFALLPKCPLCIAGYLVSLGIGAELAHRAAGLVRPLAGAALGLAILALVVAAVRRRRAPCCCV
jgi:hypothetical protein